MRKKQKRKLMLIVGVLGYLIGFSAILSVFVIDYKLKQTSPSYVFAMFGQTATTVCEIDVEKDITIDVDWNFKVFELKIVKKNESIIVVFLIFHIYSDFEYVEIDNQKIYDNILVVKIVDEKSLKVIV